MDLESHTNIDVSILDFSHNNKKQLKNVVNKENCCILKKDLAILKTRKRLVRESCPENFSPPLSDKTNQSLREVYIDPPDLPSNTSIILGGENDSYSKSVGKSTKTKSGEQKSVVDIAFKNFDDMYANFINSTMPDGIITPKRTYSHAEESLVKTNEYVDVLFGDIDKSFIPSELKVAKKQAIIDGHNDVKEILEKAGISATAYFSVLYSSKKKHYKEQTFPCKTPTNSPYVCNTPYGKFDRIQTPLPISGIRELPSSTPLKASNLMVSNSSPNISFLKKQFSPNLSPLISQKEELPPEIKSTILIGVTCFVDVRTNRENHSESVKVELLSMGANIERNFTKKVTHVVFKEGRPSIYSKAKKWKIPLVSIAWIEACKSAKKIVDCILYPPVLVERYEDPFDTLKKRRIHFLRSTDKSRKLIERIKSSATTTIEVNGLRKAVTDIKLISKQLPNLPNQDKICSKQLQFVEKESIFSKFYEDNRNCNEIECFTSIKDNDNRRNSAPAFITVSKKRKCKFYGKDGIETKEITDININSEGLVTTSKKRKLFDPNTSLVSPGSNSQSSTVSAPSSGSKIKKTLETNKKKTARTKLDFLRKRFQNKLVVSSKRTNARKSLLDNFLDAEEKSKFLSCSRRSSSSIFIEKQQCHVSNKSVRPTIVFTSVISTKLIIFKEAVHKLGIFEIESKVSERTTHVVSDGPRRTLNILKGITRGCWILDINWIEKSSAAGKWLNEEQFEMSNFCPAVLHCRLERQAFGTNFCMDLFSSVGGIYISRNTKPPWNDLAELIRLCKGHVVTQARIANIIVGNCRINETYVVVNEKWVLDCIALNRLLDMSGYKVVPNIIGK